MAYEYAPEDKRGFYTSIPQMGLSIGILLAAGALALMTSIMSNESFMSWGWRICFLMSFVLVLFGMWMRVRLYETPEFAQVKEHKDESKLPIVEMFRQGAGKVLLGMGARHVDGVFFNIFSVFAISYLINNVHISRKDALLGLMIGAVVLTICIPIAGHLSDKFSRSKLYAIAAITSALSVFPAFYVMHNSGGDITQIWLAMIIPYGIIYSVVYGNVAAFQCDLFDAKVRYTGISFVYQMTSAVAGMTALFATYLLNLGGGEPWLVCWYVLGSGVLSSLCAYAIHRRRGSVGRRLVTA